MDGPIPRRWTPYLQSVLRIVAASQFITHGTQKWFAFPVTEPRPTVQLLTWFGIAGILEIVGGTLMLLGLFTRPVAFVLVGEMAIAYFKMHFSRNAWPILNGGELAVLYCFVWLFFAAAGPGRWSLDEKMKTTAVGGER